MEPTEKKLERTSSLSSAILDYYYKFGQNRDLEKYLRRRRSCRSSSEGSLNVLADEKTHKPAKKAVENQAEGSRVKNSDSAPQDTINTKPVSKEVKVKTTGLIDGKKKSYSFNCESNIAISLPYLGPPVPAETTVADTMTESSQTDFDEVTKESSIQSVKEDTTKSHKRLEWDSLGDVGYNKTASVREQSDLAVSSLERNVLKSFFSNRGIDISFSEGGKKVVLPDIPETATPQKSQPRPKERWRETLESVKKKYDKQLLDNSSNKVEALRFNELSLNRHSTPKIERPEKGLQTSIVQTESKEVQVDLANECASAAAIDETARSSFEFVPVQLTEKENVSPNTNSSSEISQNVRCKNSQLHSKNLESSSTAVTTSSESTNNELELGIKLLCSLIESKNLTETKKKTLARKIVSRIVNRNISRCGSTSRAGSSNRLLTSSSGRSSSARAINISGLKALSRGSSTLEKSKTEKQTRARTTSTQSENTVERVMSSSNEYAKSSTTTLSSLKTTVHRDSEPKTDSTTSTKGRDSKSEVQPPTDQHQTMRTWLDPITQSEFNYNRKKSREAEIALIKKKPNVDFVPTKARRTTVPDRELVPKVVLIDQKAGGDFVPTGPRRPSQILDFITNERKSHLNWIENEIHHLENLKDLLLSNSKEKSFTSFQPAPRTELVFSAFSHRTAPNNVYDKVASSSDISSSAKSLPANYRETEVVSEKEIVNIGQGYRRTEKRHEDEILYDTVTTKERPETEPIRRTLKTTSLEIHEEKRFPKKNYLSDNECAGAKNRSKLETPKTGADESVTTFARQRKEEFLKNYNKPQQPTTDYDDPAETDHYSEPCEPAKSKPKPSKPDVYNSATSSDFFVSSESISLPGGSTSATTTTHQYDSRTGIGIQTTDSLMLTRPIYGPQYGCECKKPQVCCCPRPTIRTYRSGRNKQTQVKPKSMAYVITFDSTKEKYPYRSESSGSLTLRDHLEKRRPEFAEHINQRRDVLKKLHNLRQVRDENIREIIENTSVTSIPKKLKNLPPPPTKHVRIFATKEMKAMTRKKYSQLPEVVERVEQMKIEKRKKTNKIMVDVFNKKIQQRVHKGKISLEHSMTVI